MIRGIVTADREAMIRLTVGGRSGRRKSIDAVIDTGFDDFLSLPPSLIQALDLPWWKRGRALLGDGSTCVFDIYRGWALWDGHRRPVSIHAAETAPLIGMALLDGYQLDIRVCRGGQVMIKRLRK